MPGVKHGFASGKADSTDTTLVQPSHWNAEHVSPPFSVPLQSPNGILAYTNMPAALSEWRAINLSRVKADLSGSAECRLTAAVHVVGSANAEVRVQYATDGDAQGTWAFLDGADGPKVNISVLNGRASAWVPLAAGAKADVWLRFVSINGDGAADPVVGNAILHLR